MLFCIFPDNNYTLINFSSVYRNYSSDSFCEKGSSSHSLQVGVLSSWKKKGAGKGQSRLTPPATAAERTLKHVFIDTVLIALLMKVLNSTVFREKCYCQACWPSPWTLEQLMSLVKPSRVWKLSPGRCASM